MPEWLSFGLELAVVGLIIVFAALTIIATAVSLIRRGNDAWQKHEDAQSEAATEKEQNIDTITLLLISTAAATMIQGRFHIKSIRRILPANAQRGPWSLQGRAVLLGSHVVSKKRQ
ncbi:MAG: hypothetical protein CVT49_09835 [candidate division Zixibacteria bacterium HGW-Zixibacteria-1]|nr:MAG: hypothetical protein CVT49_09835 [candidate division Zixibacteria bacterium HGW-Zixibacteria-1]